MPYRRQGMAKRPINSNKEVVDIVALLVAAGVTTDVDIATAVNSYAGVVGTVPLGSSILGFYLETSTATTDSSVARTDWYLCKRTSLTPFGSFPIPGSTGGSPNRKWIFHESKGLGQGIASGTVGQTTRTREFIKIPKRYRRMGEGDVWSIRVGSSQIYNYCLKAIYKRFV